MELESLKIWQWVLAGLVAGALYSCVLAWRGPAFDTQDRDTIEQGEFENNCFMVTKFGRMTGPLARYYSEYHKDQPTVRDVTVHPPIAGDPTHNWVTGRFFSISIKPDDPNKVGGTAKIFSEWKLFKFPAPIPYEPGYALRDEKKLDRNPKSPRNVQLAELKKALGGQSVFPTVKQYLTAIETLPQNNFKFQYAWWELPAAMWTLPPLAGLLMIGIAWPLTLSAMQSYGLAKRPASKAKPKPAPAKPARPAVKGMPAGMLMRPTSPPPPPVPAERKEYGGEFYPVVKTTHKE